jgi:hypothetical protein
MALRTGSCALIILFLGSLHSFALPQCAADVFVLDSFAKEPIVAAPDHVHAIHLKKNYHFQVMHDGRVVRDLDIKELSAGIFIKWAPDSKAFFIMWSNGGMVGGYDVRVFTVDGDTVTSVPTLRLAKKDFERRHYCRARGNNYYALQWVDGSNALDVMTEVYPTSDCGKDLGHDEGYRVDTRHGTILKRYTLAELKQIASRCLTKIWPTALWNDDDLNAAKQERDKQESKSH